MKHKFSKILGLGLTLALLASMLITATPVAAAVDTVTVDVNPELISTVAEYTIGFNTGAAGGLTMNVGTITVTFPDDTEVTASYATGAITVDGTAVPDTAISVTGRAVTITTPVSISASSAVVVIFTTAASIVNPTTAGVAYTLAVETSADATANSAAYTIIGLPTIISVQPVSGNVGDTMWVEVIGSNFIEDDTALDFGVGVSVVADSYQYVDTDEIDCQIEITLDGLARDVVATTGAGTGTEGGPFDPNALDTAQVDVWDTYTPEVDSAVGGTWTINTLAMTDAGNPFATIQAAVTACGAAETAIVHADTYAENLIIDEEIILLSLSGTDSTIIDGGSAVLIVSVTAGATIDGFTIQGDATTTNQAGILVSGVDVDDFAIQNNKFVDIANDNLKVWSNAGAITAGLIDNNTLTGLGADAQRACILVESFDNASNGISGVKITDNIISNFLGVDAHEWPGIQVSEIGEGAISNITITGNNISNGATGIKLTGDIAGLTGNYAVAGNHISEMFEGGVSADNGSPEFDLENNTITGCRYGIEMGSSTGAHTIRYNDISGNDWGLLVPEDSATITAKYNWWGDKSGPSSGSQLTPVFTWWSDVVSTALGSGDAMSRYVDAYDPWLTELQDTVITSGIRSYGSDALELELGWNTLSVPCGLKSTGDTFGEIDAMGDFLGDNLAGGYWYNASNGAWTLIGPTTTIEPGKGFYVNMNAASHFPVLLFDGLLSLPSYDLYTGWNLVGSMFGIDTDYGVAPDSGEGDEVIATALDSIQDSGSVIISPSLPGQKLAWAYTVAETGVNMIVGEAYWVFMTADGTLAGWEVLPSCFEPGTMD